MAADATTLTEKMRAALRISSTNAKITEEIEDCRYGIITTNRKSLYFQGV